MLDRISGFMFYMMIIAGIAAIDCNEFSDMLWQLLITCTVGAVATAYIRLVSSHIYRGYEHEFISMFGMLTGTASNDRYKANILTENKHFDKIMSLTGSKMKKLFCIGLFVLYCVAVGATTVVGSLLEWLPIFICAVAVCGVCIFCLVIAFVIRVCGHRIFVDTDSKYFYINRNMGVAVFAFFWGLALLAIGALFGYRNDDVAGQAVCGVLASVCLLYSDAAAVLKILSW